MRNRYGDEYNFQRISDNVYTIVGELNYWRYGGQDGQDRVDYANLGFVDPSGGPFMSIGYQIEGRKVIRIFLEGDQIHFEVDN